MDAQAAQLADEAREAFGRGDFRTALRLFRQVLVVHPDFADIRHYAGLCLSFLGEPQEALEQFDEALARNPGYVEAHISRALTLNNVGRVDEGREAFERAARSEEEASGEFSSAVAGRLANGHAALGDMYVAAGALALGEEQYRRALDLRPRFHDIRNRLAECLLERGEVAEAVLELREVLAWNERFLAARINLGLAYARLGRREDALAEWRRCERQEPDNPQVRAFLSTVEPRPGEADAP